jgi:FtsP/CotA-like multicopper oxidase with cupredoxin domain
MLTRRQLLIAGLAADADTQLPRMAPRRTPAAAAMSFDGTILPGTLMRGLMGSTNGPPPVLRLTQGQPAEITVENALQKVTTVHRHGLRIPMDQDGEPYLSQIPIGVGESHSYRFPPQDAGTS